MNQLAQFFQFIKNSCGVYVLSAFLMIGKSAGEEIISDINNHALHDRWVNFGGTSWHSHNNSERNTANYGFGLEYGITQRHALVVGQYVNSFYDQTRYAGIAWMPIKFYGAKLGLVLGCADGYRVINHGHFFPFVLPAASIEGQRFGMNLLYMPPINDKMQNTFALQFKVRY